MKAVFYPEFPQILKNLVRDSRPISIDVLQIRFFEFLRLLQVPRVP